MMFQLFMAKKHGERGAALLVSLVMLSLLTIIGVASMKATILESKMAGNIQSGIETFNDAESALRAAEADLQQNIIDAPGVFDFSVANDGYYMSDVTPVDISTLAWNNNDSESIGNGRYIVEYLGSRPVPGQSVTQPAHVLQITARSINQAKGMPQIVRSTYMTFDQP